MGHQWKRSEGGMSRQTWRGWGRQEGGGGGGDGKREGGGGGGGGKISEKE